MNKCFINTCNNIIDNDRGEFKWCRLDTCHRFLCGPCSFKFHYCQDHLIYNNNNNNKLIINNNNNIKQITIMTKCYINACSRTFGKDRGDFKLCNLGTCYHFLCGSCSSRFQYCQDHLTYNPSYNKSYLALFATIGRLN